MEVTLRTLLVFALVFALALPFVNAANSTIAAGGNITEVNITVVQLTPNWQGFSGQVFFGTNASSPNITNATGRNVNATNIFIQIACDNPTSASGFIFFSNVSTPPAGLVPGNLSVLNSFVTIAGNDADNATNTFTTTSSFAFTTGTIAGVPTTFTFVNQLPQSSSFRQGYFNQGNDLVFATVIEADLTGYNGSFFDYQAIVPAPNLTTVPYFIFTDITFTCPGGAAAGGGGGSRGGPQICVLDCDAWTQCSPNGLQQRVCRPRNPIFCSPPYVQPSTTRTCTPGKTPRLEQPEAITEREILTAQFLRNLKLAFEPARGDILAQTLVRGAFSNLNDRSIEDVHFEVTTPEIIVAAMPAHPYPKLLWGLNGWADHSTPTPKAFVWQVSAPPQFAHINPQVHETVAFTVIPPVMQPLQTDLGVSAFTGPVRVASASVPFTVTVPAFSVAGTLSERNVLALYFVVDNRGKQGKDINIELDLNRGKGTLVAELLGPLHVAADSVAIFGHEYKLGSAALRADRVTARLFSADGTKESSYALR